MTDKQDVHHTTKTLARTRIYVAALLLLFTATSALAQPVGGTNVLVAKQALPKRGISMEGVENRYGPPRQMIPPVGDPPITRWIYDHYVVYFEYDLVIHVVSSKK